MNAYIWLMRFVFSNDRVFYRHIQTVVYRLFDVLCCNLDVATLCSCFLSTIIVYNKGPWCFPVAQSCQRSRNLGMSRMPILLMSGFPGKFWPRDSGPWGSFLVEEKGRLKSDEQ